MRRTRNLQQQCMKRIFGLSALILIVLAGTACTRMPAEYRQNGLSQSASPVIDPHKLAVVAATAVGSAAIYRDYLTGLTSEITVESEYFSANGRICRRFTERQAASASSQRRLGCHSDSGWVEIPVASFAG